MQRTLIVLGGALVINGIMLGLATRLSSKGSHPAEFTAPVPVHLAQLPPPSPSREPAPAEPERPEPLSPSAFNPDVAQPLLEAPGLDVLVLRVAPPPPSGLDLKGLFVFDAADLDQVPRALVNQQPLYPFRAQQMEVEGWVTVRFLVGADGTVSRLRVLDASPEGVFEDAVLQVVSHWRFHPGMIGGSPVPSWVENTIRFELN